MNEILTEIRQALEPIKEQHGEVFYSPLSSLSHRKYYLCGLNPGMYPKGNSPFDGQEAPEIAEVLKRIEEDSIKNYMKQSFGKMQKDVEHLFEMLGDQEMNEVFATNVYFVQTPDEDNLLKYLGKKRDKSQRIDGLMECSETVHKRMLEAVSPQVILAIGNSEDFSAFQYFRDYFGVSKEDVFKSPALAGKSYTTIKVFKSEHNKKPIVVVGLPHFSHFPLTGAYEERLLEVIKIYNLNS